MLFISSNIIENSKINFEEFPLNLLLDINNLITFEMVFITCIINVFIVKKIIQLDLIQKLPLPANRLGNLIKYFINRYINIWKNHGEKFTIFCFVFLSFDIYVTKFLMFYVLNS